MLFTKKFKKIKMINYSASKKLYGAWNFIDIIYDFNNNQYNKRNQNLNFDYIGIKCRFLKKCSQEHNSEHNSTQ